MIYTVTFNPSLDYSIRINDFAFGGLNRIGEETHAFENFKIFL